MHKHAIPPEISDVARLNKNYKKLSNKLSVSDVSNQETLEKIFHS